MYILLHSCCGPCSITVLQHLLAEGHAVTGLFFNPNIHPLAEYLRRREAAAEVFARLHTPLIFADTLPEALQHWLPQTNDLQRSLPEGQATLPPAVTPHAWLAHAPSAPEGRCHFCWRTRLAYTAKMAALWRFDAFTSSLLYSRYQDHNHLCQHGLTAEKTHTVPFYYHDFRSHWEQGISLAKAWGLYRQPYCGCVFSEYERYAKKFRHAQKIFASAPVHS